MLGGGLADLHIRNSVSYHIMVIPLLKDLVFRITGFQAGLRTALIFFRNSVFAVLG